LHVWLLLDLRHHQHLPMCFLLMLGHVIVTTIITITVTMIIDVIITIIIITGIIDLGIVDLGDRIAIDVIDTEIAIITITTIIADPVYVSILASKKMDIW